MNDVTSRATALKSLIESGGQERPPQPLAEAVIHCCLDLISAGETNLAMSLIDSASSIGQSTDREWNLRFQLVRARVLRAKGEFRESLALSTSLLVGERELLRQHRETDYELRINEAANLTQLNRADEAIEKLISIRSELVTQPDSSLMASCAFQLSTAELLNGEPKRAKNFALEALVSARRAGNRLLEGLSLDNLSRLDRARCRWGSAEESVLEALEIFEFEGYRFYAATAGRCLAIVQWKRGNLGKALRSAGESRDLARSVGSGLHEWYAELLRGMIVLHAGDYPMARKLFTSGANWDVPDAHSRPSLLTTEFLGDIHLEQGEAAPALRYYDEVWPKALALVPKGDIVAELRRRRAEAYYLLGRFEEAYAEAKTGLDHCRELGDRYEEAATYRVLALSAASIGKPAEAKQWFDQGFAYYDDIETPYEWGKLWLAYGDWLNGPHAAEYADRRGALEAYQAARDHFERMGALAKLAHANECIAAATPPPTPSAPISTKASETHRPQRRPRGSAELERRIRWAREAFGLITGNPGMLRLLENVDKLAKSNTPVLVLGESGTGKELIAHGLHRLSGRTGQFVPINCSALPREIIESELFGHVAGAFTGATREKPGLFEVCEGGTVFLDEIAELPIELQARLLRFLETGEVRRIGSNKNISVKARVVAATNRERVALERGDGFRTDLYYRLAHAVVVLPPLRRRGDDVELLIDHFFDATWTEEGKRVELSSAARERMREYSWPGNVRQLRAMIRRVVILGSNGHEISEHELELDEGRAPTTLNEELAQAERSRIVEALAHARGSKTVAAKALGMPRTTLIHKMHRYGLE